MNAAHALFLWLLLNTLTVQMVDTFQNYLYKHLFPISLHKEQAVGCGYICVQTHRKLVNFRLAISHLPTKLLQITLGIVIKVLW